MSCGGQAPVIDALVVVDANYGGGERFLPEGEREKEREREEHRAEEEEWSSGCS